MLKDKLKEQEIFREQLRSDTDKLTHDYHLKTKELKKLEEEFVEKQTKLSNLERELESLRNYHKFSKEEKGRLAEEIERLTIEKKRLISKKLCIIFRLNAKRERWVKERERGEFENFSN